MVRDDGKGVLEDKKVENHCSYIFDSDIIRELHRIQGLYMQSSEVHDIYERQSMDLA